MADKDYRSLRCLLQLKGCKPGERWSVFFMKRLTDRLAVSLLARCSAWLCILSLEAPSVKTPTLASYPYVRIRTCCSSRAAGGGAAGTKVFCLRVAHARSGR